MRQHEKISNMDSNYKEDSDGNHSEESCQISSDKDKNKFMQLKESKRRFLNELNEGSDQGDLKTRMEVLVKKAESLANFLLTKHKYKE